MIRFFLLFFFGKWLNFLCVYNVSQVWMSFEQQHDYIYFFCVVKWSQQSRPCVHLLLWSILLSLFLSLSPFNILLMSGFWVYFVYRTAFKIRLGSTKYWSAINWMNKICNERASLNKEKYFTTPSPPLGYTQSMKVYGGLHPILFDEFSGN